MQLTGAVALPLTQRNKLAAPSGCILAVLAAAAYCGDTSCSKAPHLVWRRACDSGGGGGSGLCYRRRWQLCCCCISSGHTTCTLAPADAALDYAVAQSYDHMYGARPLRRWLEHSVVTPLSRMIISGGHYN